VDLYLEQAHEAGPLQLARVGSQETHLLGVMSMCTGLIKSLSNGRGLPKFQQIDFVEKINNPDMHPNDIRSVLFNPSKSTRVSRRKARKGTGSKFWQY
jgi:hypothetical protein